MIQKKVLLTYAYPPETLLSTLITRVYPFQLLRTSCQLSCPKEKLELFLWYRTLGLLQYGEESSQTQHNAEDKAGRDRDVRDNGESGQRATSERAVDEVGVVVTHKRYSVCR